MGDFRLQWQKAIKQDAFPESVQPRFLARQRCIRFARLHRVCIRFDRGRAVSEISHCRTRRTPKIVSVQGVSTRRVTAVMDPLCGLEVSSTQVSRAAKLLDEELTAWRQRPIGEIPYLVLDARYEKVRHGGSVVSCAVLIAVGVVCVRCMPFPPCVACGSAPIPVAGLDRPACGVPWLALARDLRRIAIARQSPAPAPSHSGCLACFPMAGRPDACLGSARRQRFGGYSAASPRHHRAESGGGAGERLRLKARQPRPPSSRRRCGGPPLPVAASQMAMAAPCSYRTSPAVGRRRS